LTVPLGPATGGVIKGQFYVVGISGGTASVQLFDGNSWSALTTPTQPLADAAAAVLNNVLFIFDGANIHAYDPVANIWSDKTGLLSVARLQPQPVTIGNLIYVADNDASALKPVLESFASDEATWSSSDTAIASVDSKGNAGALKVGSAQITATSILTPSIAGSATMTVVQATVTPALAASNKTYDTTPAATITNCTVSPVVGSDDVACTVGSATFPDKNVGDSKTVTGTGIALTGTTASNYVLSSTTATTTANIAQAPLTVTATGVNKVYDATTAATVTLSDNHLGSDVVTDSYTSATLPTRMLGLARP